MANDFSDLLIPTFPSINDQPISPTATRAGNGAHLIKSYNDLIDKLNNVSFRWKIIDSDVVASAGDKLIVFNDANALVVITFPTLPVAGDCISLLLASGIVYLANIPVLNNVGVIEISLGAVFEPIELVYINEAFGWLASRANILQVTDENNPPPA